MLPETSIFNTTRFSLHFVHIILSGIQTLINKMTNMACDSSRSKLLTSHHCGLGLILNQSWDLRSKNGIIACFRQAIQFPLPVLILPTALAHQSSSPPPGAGTIDQVLAGISSVSSFAPPYKLTNTITVP
jgi:hypothetical protein